MKKLILSVFIIFVVTGIIFAQSLPSGGWTSSPQNMATQGRYRSAADNFIRPDAFSGVSFNSFYSMASFASIGTAQLGFATKISDIYFATAYAGSLWNNKTQFNYTEGYLADWPGGAKTAPSYTNITITSLPSNQVALLFGTEDFGFRFTFTSTHQSFSDKDFFSGVIYYKEYLTARGLISPQFAFSLTKDLNPNGIRPNATLDLNFNRNFTKGEAYNPDGTTAGMNVTNSVNYFEPIFNIGLGGYTLYRSEGGFRMSADLGYTLTMRMYNNEYSYHDGNTFKTAKIKSNGIISGSYVFGDYSYSENLLTPSLAGQWSSGPIAVRFLLNMPLRLVSINTTNMIIDTDNPESGTLRKQGNDEKSTMIGLRPDLRLAAQWRIIPNLTLNMGGQIAPTQFTRTVIKGDSYTNGTKNDNSSIKDVRKVYGTSFTNNFTAGLTFNPISNLSFEVSSGIGSTAANSISIFDPEGFMNFTRLMLSIRF